MILVNIKTLTPLGHPKNICKILIFLWSVTIREKLFSWWEWWNWDFANFVGNPSVHALFSAVRDNKQELSDTVAEHRFI